MPRYTYKCVDCDTIAVISHRVSERRTDCDACQGRDTLKKVPSIINIDKESESSTATVGSIVKEHIEDTKEEITLLKEKLRGNIFENE